MNPIDNRLSWAQIWLSVLFIAGAFGVIVLYEIGKAHFATPDAEKAFERIVHFLEDAVLLILYFWFQRIRGGGIPDVPTTVTQTQTAPDGTKTSVTSPAHLPLPKLPDPTQPASPAKP